MDAVALIRAGADVIRTYGFTWGTRVNHEGVCALGALDVASGQLVIDVTERRHLRRGEYAAPVALDAYMVAVEALSATAGEVTESDRFNAQHDIKQFATAGPVNRVAWYSNTHTKEQVLEWFEDAAIWLEMQQTPKKVTELVKELVTV
jgi:hypothetical protein